MNIPPLYIENMAIHDFKIRELDPADASFSFSPDLLDASSPILDKSAIIGQPRALRALEMGIGINRWGYNIFVSGDSGTGKLPAIKAIASRYEKDIAQLRDIAYVHNFTNPDSPRVLVFSPGNGMKFFQDMEVFCSHLDLWLKEGTEETAIEQGTEAIKKLMTAYPEGKVNQHLHNIQLDLSRHLQSHQNLNRYRVNLIINHQFTTRKPFVVENHPSFINLFGGLAKNKKGKLLPYQMIKAGTIHEAMGGILVLRSEEVLQEISLWETLKRYLEANRQALKDPLASQKGGTMGKNIRPEIPPLLFKLILIGSEADYDKLSENDEQFLKYFKISAQFDYSMEATKENANATVQYLRNFASRQGLLELTDDGALQLLRYSAWFAEDRRELTTQFSQLTDILMEADWWAHRLGKDKIDKMLIIRANDERDYASSLTESKINRDIEQGDMLISLSGNKVGVVNGLAVMDRGAASFGTPTVITASVAPGSEGIVNIEHEAGLSGEIHDKGLLIMEGYLRKHYARTFPLSFYAGICFEQSYAEIDGDSASSTELYALLSAIAEIPIRQDIAVTGSVNQLGSIQPVGGINEKIEGFYNACFRLGLTGKQGVIIPQQNIDNLILSHHVQQAIKDGKFHIYPITTIDEGMQILTNRSAGTRGPKGNFPVGTFNRDVEDALKKLYQMGSSNRN
ncbi:MAG: AAA family ATPase [Spirochaetia bacterium]|nr:AAA family ATPase [Spirochaetia bacterium]